MCLPFSFSSACFSPTPPPSSSTQLTINTRVNTFPNDWFFWTLYKSWIELLGIPHNNTDLFLAEEQCGGHCWLRLTRESQVFSSQ